MVELTEETVPCLIERMGLTQEELKQMCKEAYGKVLN